MVHEKELRAFQTRVWNYYKQHNRPMPWREDTSPYAIFVSEIMLQQTQVPRVIPKFEAFMAALPSFEALGKADNADVLQLWSGLGYNRRALNLKKAAQIVMHDFNGQLPDTMEDLVKLPGIGAATAGAILAYAFNKPVVYIETNIRAIYLHEFFPHEENVSDEVLLPLIEATVKKRNAREWYWALMDYGTMLKQTKGNAARRSKHYTKQSTFEGSVRQMRGILMRLFLEDSSKCYTLEELMKRFDDGRIPQALTGLVKDGTLTDSNGNYSLT